MGHFAIVLLSAALLLPSPALADTFRVEPGEGNPIQAAVDAASDGDTILVGAGTYSNSVQVTGKNSLRIRGVEGTVLDSSGIYLDGCERVTIEGIAFVDATDTQLAIDANGCPRLVLRGLRVEGYDGTQILLEDCDGARVSRCAVVGGTGAGLRDLGSADLVVEKSTFTGNAGWAIDLTTGDEGGSPRARLSKNTVAGPAFGIAADGEDLRVEGNTVTLESGPGILLGVNADALRALVQRNAVETTGVPHRGIDVEGVACRVARNTVTGESGIGIIVQGDGSRIESNAVIGGGISQAFHCDGVDLRITGNLSEGAQGISFFVAQGADSVLTKNRALDAGNTAFALNQAGSVLVKNVSEGAQTGFSLGFPPMTLTGNVAEGSSYTDVFSTYSESQYVLSRNRFTTFVWDYVFEDPL